MGLTNPTPGEIIDRLAVLQIKIQKARAKRLPYQHFTTEQDTLWTRLSEQVGRLGPEALSMAMALSQVHITLWAVVEKQRAFTLKQKTGAAAGILTKLEELNSRRVELREGIDKLLGTYVGHEKL